MVGPIDMQSVILNSYTQSNINNNLLVQAAQAENVRALSKKKEKEEESTKVESASNTQNPTISEKKTKKPTEQTDTKKHIDLKA